MGFDGFTHGVRISDVSLEEFRSRPYVANVQFDYCIASNSDDCGNGVIGGKDYTSAERAALVKMNGGGSNYYFSLIALPAN